MKETTTSIGQLGESVAVKFLEDRGYKIIDRNFLRSCGELDVIAVKEELVFVEVKSVRCRIPQDLPKEGSDVYRPEENVSHHKRERLRRIIEVYLSIQEVNQPWRCDLLCVFLDPKREEARVKWLENIII